MAINRVYGNLTKVMSIFYVSMFTFFSLIYIPGGWLFQSCGVIIAVVASYLVARYLGKLGIIGGLIAIYLSSFFSLIFLDVVPSFFLIENKAPGTFLIEWATIILYSIIRAGYAEFVTGKLTGVPISRLETKGRIISILILLIYGLPLGTLAILHPRTPLYELFLSLSNGLFRTLGADNQPTLAGILSTVFMVMILEFPRLGSLFFIKKYFKRENNPNSTLSSPIRSKEQKRSQFWKFR